MKAEQMKQRDLIRRASVSGFRAPIVLMPSCRLKAGEAKPGLGKEGRKMDVRRSRLGTQSPYSANLAKPGRRSLDVDLKRKPFFDVIA